MIQNVPILAIDKAGATRESVTVFVALAPGDEQLLANAGDSIIRLTVPR